MNPNPRPAWCAAALVCGALALVPVAACSSRNVAASVLEHEHGNAMVTLQIKSAAITPTADLTIPLFSAVCWLHAAAASKPIEVELDRSPGVCGSCATILGFGVTSDGKAQTKARIAPSSVALICFHESGNYRYTISGLEKPLSGTIHVLAAKQGKP